MQVELTKSRCHNFIKTTYEASTEWHFPRTRGSYWHPAVRRQHQVSQVMNLTLFPSRSPAVSRALNSRLVFYHTWLIRSLRKTCHMQSEADLWHLRAETIICSMRNGGVGGGHSYQTSGLLHYFSRCSDNKVIFTPRNRKCVRARRRERARVCEPGWLAGWLVSLLLTE